MNRGQLVVAVKSYLNRPNLEDDDIGTMIASVEGEFNRELRKHPRNMRRTSYTIPENDEAGTPYTENTDILPLPTDIASLIAVWDAQNGQSKPYRQYPPSVPLPSYGYIERGDCLQIFPMPSRGTEFFLDYTAFIAPLEATADTNWVSDYFSDLYLYGVLKEAAVYLKNDARLAAWQNEFLRRLKGVKAQGWNQNMASSPKIRNG